MSRSERLFDLLQTLRRHRLPVSGKVLADEIGVSIRTLYRDIASLQAQGAIIEGEPGVGYVLKPGFFLPPLMFPPEEIEALVLGSRWVADRADDHLRDAARSALARIAAVLPPDLRDELDASALLVGPGADIPADAIDPALLRKAIRAERKLSLSYRDGSGTGSQRVVWAFRARLFRPCAHCAGVVRTAPGFPLFPHGSHRPCRAARHPVSQAPSDAAETVAGHRENFATGRMMLPETGSIRS